MRITLTLIALAVLVALITHNNKGRAQRSVSRSRGLTLLNVATNVTTEVTTVATRVKRTTKAPKPIYGMIPKDYEADIVSRLNYGAYYTHVAATNIVNAIWHHGLLINLPNEAWAETKDEAELKALAACQGTEATKTGCDKYPDHYAMIRKIRSNGFRTLMELHDSIHGLVSAQEDKNTNRDKKSLFPFIGQFLGSSLGLVTESDFHTLEAHMDQTHTLVKDQLKISKESEEHLASFVALSTTRMDSLAQLIKNSTLESFKWAEMQAQDANAQLRFSNSLTTKMADLQLKFDNIIEQYTLALDGLQTLVSGYLPAYFVHPSALKKVIDAIQEELVGSGSSVMHIDPAWYYKSGAFVALVKDKTIILNLQIPLTAMPHSFDVFTIKTVPMILEKNSNHVMQLENMPYAIAIDKSQTWYFEMNRHEMQEMINHHTSKVQRVFRRIASPSCAVAIFRDQPANIDRKCKYTIITEASQPAIYHLSRSNFLLVNVDKYTLICQEDYEEVKSIATGCNSCILKLKANCAIQTNMFFIPKTINGATDDGANMVKHTTNLGLLIKFFDPAELTAMRGDTVWESAPTARLPTMKFVEKSVEDRFKVDGEQRISLEKVVSQIKQDAVIMSALEEPVFNVKVTEWFEFWLSAPGGILTAVTVLVLLLAVDACYLTYKMKQMLVSLAIILEHVNSAKGEDEPIVLDFYKGKEPIIESVKEGI